MGGCSSPVICLARQIAVTSRVVGMGVVGTRIFSGLVYCVASDADPAGKKYKVKLIYN